MISIRFFCGRALMGAPFSALLGCSRAAIGGPLTSAMLPLARSPLRSDRLVQGAPALIYLAHGVLAREQVEVADDLGERQEGLRHGHVAPDLLRDLVRAAGALAHDRE